MNLTSVRTRARLEIQEGLLFIAAGHEMVDLGDVFEHLSECFQSLGICYFLETTEVVQFRENLVRSGYARRYFLRKSREEGNLQDRHLALGRSEAFLDSVAAGHMELARTIAELSLGQWEPNWEYEDDYCFFQFLHTLVKNSPEGLKDQLRKILIRFERSLDGGISIRLDICKALLSRSADEFVEAIKALMEERQELNDRERTLTLETDSLFWPRSFVSIEGLALLKLAEICGIEVKEDLVLCPSAARLSTTDQKFRDFFQEIERERAGGAL